MSVPTRQSRLSPIRKNGAEQKINKACQLLEERGAACGVMLSPEGGLDITAAIFVACGAKISQLNSSDGNPELAGLSPVGTLVALELIQGFEALVDEDITTWGDNHTATEAIHILKRLSGYYK